MTHLTPQPNSPFLLVGLGNPGKHYAGTRHNLGFQVIDRLLFEWKAPQSTRKFQSDFFEAADLRQRVYLQKPTTFMNLSGQAVGEAARYLKVPHDHCLLIYDDLDLPPGQLRFRLSGGPGGHNGMKSVIEHLGGETFPRLRVGIGRPAHGSAEQYVLEKIPRAETVLYKEAVERAAQGIVMLLDQGQAVAMNWINTPKNEEAPSDGT